MDGSSSALAAQRCAVCNSELEPLDGVLRCSSCTPTAKSAWVPSKGDTLVTAAYVRAGARVTRAILRTAAGRNLSVACGAALVHSDYPLGGEIRTILNEDGMPRLIVDWIVSRSDNGYNCNRQEVPAEQIVAFLRTHL